MEQVDIGRLLNVVQYVFAPPFLRSIFEDFLHVRFSVHIPEFDLEAVIFKCEVELQPIPLDGILHLPVFKLVDPCFEAECVDFTSCRNS